MVNFNVKRTSQGFVLSNISPYRTRFMMAGNELSMSDPLKELEENNPKPAAAGSGLSDLQRKLQDLNLKSGRLNRKSSISFSA